MILNLQSVAERQNDRLMQQQTDADIHRKCEFKHFLLKILNYGKKTIIFSFNESFSLTCRVKYLKNID